MENSAKPIHKTRDVPQDPGSNIRGRSSHLPRPSPREGCQSPQSGSMRAASSAAWPFEAADLPTTAVSSAAVYGRRLRKPSPEGRETLPLGGAVARNAVVLSCGLVCCCCRPFEIRQTSSLLAARTRSRFILWFSVLSSFTALSRFGPKLSLLTGVVLCVQVEPLVAVTIRFSFPVPRAVCFASQPCFQPCHLLSASGSAKAPGVRRNLHGSSACARSR